MSEAEPPRRTLKRELGVAAVTALVIGEVIAVGIFLTPASMARSLGSPLLLLVVWLVMGGMAVTGALCYGELAARLPEAGGGYVYLRDAYGPAISFLYGWKCMLVMDPGITAALAVGLGSYVGYVFALGAAAQKAVAVGAILALAIVNIFGVRLGARLMQWITAFKLGALALIVVLGQAHLDWPSSPRGGRRARALVRARCAGGARPDRRRGALRRGGVLAHHVGAQPGRRARRRGR